MKTVRNKSNTGSKSYFWLLVRRIHGSASKKQIILVEAVWVMPSVTGCQTFSTAIRKTKPKISDGGTFRYIFAARFNGKKPEEKRRTLAKFCSILFMTNHNLSTPWQKSGRLDLEKKNWKLRSWQIFEQFRKIWSTKNQAHVQTGSPCVMT